VAETLKDELRKAADIERVPYAEERETFVQRAGRTDSEWTSTNSGASWNVFGQPCRERDPQEPKKLIVYKK
jgi:hypothetical protein